MDVVLLVDMLIKLLIKEFEFVTKVLQVPDLYKGNDVFPDD